MRCKNLPIFFCTLIVLLTLMAQTFKFNFFITDYYVNTANYIKKCINKSKPQSNCQGKCQMMKKMREEQQKEEKSSGNRADNKFETLSCFNSFYELSSTPLHSSTNNFPPFSEGKIQDFISSPFHPPGV